MKLYPNITVYFLIWFICLLAIFLFGLSGKDLITNLANWDGGHFLTIAKFGYQEKYLYAFFPLYPVTINLVSKITGDYLIAALLISIVSAFLTIQILYRLILLDFGKILAEKTIIFLLIFPTSFFLITAYSESLFLLLVVSSFYFFRKEKLFWATLFAGFASGTRLAGLAVSLAIIFQIITTSGINKKNRIILLTPMGFIIYCIYLFNATGDPFYFLYSETSNWQRSLSIPGLSFWQTLKNQNYIELVFGIFGLGMVLRSFRFLPAVYSVYGLFSILLPVATSSLVSIPRFILPIFPIFILLSMLKNPKVIFFAQLISILFLSAFGILFINGFWVS